MKEYFKNRTQYFFVAVIILLLSGCLSTELSSPIPHPTISKLQKSNTKSIALEISNIVPEKSLGHQYLFILIPFGTIYHPYLKSQITETATTLLSLSGRRVILEPTLHDQIPKLTLRIQKVQLSAYDFLFFRRIVCNITLEGEFLRDSQHTANKWQTTQSFSEYKTMAFTPQLQHTLDKTLDLSIQAVLQEFGLKRDYLSDRTNYR